MATTNDATTLVCLFHHQDHADAAANALTREGISASSISRIGGPGSETNAESSLQGIGIPERDMQHLLEGVHNGGVILVVDAMSGQIDAIEKIFDDQNAAKIDETDVRPATMAAPIAAIAAADMTAGERAIPIVQEELVVGKRTVDQGGVRVYRKVVEIPVEQSVTLREEHVNVERRPVDRAVTDQDLAMQGDRTIELTETAEEVVIGKNARVVEEVLVGKQASERTEHVQDTVRHTEVEVEEVTPENELRGTNLRDESHTGRREQ